MIIFVFAIIKVDFGCQYSGVALITQDDSFVQPVPVPVQSSPRRKQMSSHWWSQMKFLIPSIPKLPLPKVLLKIHNLKTQSDIECWMVNWPDDPVWLSLDQTTLARPLPVLTLNRTSTKSTLNNAKETESESVESCNQVVFKVGL